MTRNQQNSRIGVRLSQDSKKLIEQAAGHLGLTVSAFTVATLGHEAEKTIERFEQFRRSERDREAFLATLDKPPDPPARLLDAANKHKKWVR